MKHQLELCSYTNRMIAGAQEKPTNDSSDKLARTASTRVAVSCTASSLSLRLLSSADQSLG